MSGANSTPLGKAHTSLGSIKKAPVNLGGSLLNPSYMVSGAGGNGSMLPPPALQACSIGAAAAAAAKAAAALAINTKVKRDSSPSRGH